MNDSVLAKILQFVSSIWQLSSEIYIYRGSNFNVTLLGFLVSFALFSVIVGTLLASIRVNIVSSRGYSIRTNEINQRAESRQAKRNNNNSGES